MVHEYEPILWAATSLALSALAVLVGMVLRQLAAARAEARFVRYFALFLSAVFFYLLYALSHLVWPAAEEVFEPFAHLSLLAFILYDYRVWGFQ